MMRDQDKGFYVVKGYDMARHYAIDLHRDYLGFAAFTEVDVDTGEDVDVDYDSMKWAELEEYLSTPYRSFHASGMPDTMYAGAVVADFPLTQKPVRYGGRVYLHIDGMRGRDEWTDYSLIDLATGPDGMVLPWRNRLAASAREKIDTSFRHRARAPQQIGAVIFLPFKVDDLRQARVEVVTGPNGAHLLNDTKLSGEIDGPKVIPDDGLWYRQFYFEAKAPKGLTVPAGGEIDIPMQLHWQKPKSPKCHGALTLKVEEIAGYAPIKRVDLDGQGSGHLRAVAVGMRPGERMVFKINADHFSGLGKLVVEVV